MTPALRIRSNSVAKFRGLITHGPHDRAVFHFRTDPDYRRSYVELARQAVPEGGHLIIATFADDGPKRCSDLDVCRYNARSLAAELGEGFSLVREARETHTTPWGSS